MAVTCKHHQSVSTRRVHARGCVAAAPFSGSGPKPVTAPALKEWAATCSALGCGVQTILLRKGGIREPSFSLQTKRFWLFPNSFHSQPGSLTPEASEKFSQFGEDSVQELLADPRKEASLKFDTLSVVSGAWTTDDPEVLEALQDFHVWGPDFYQQRLAWRHKQPVMVLELETDYAITDLSWEQAIPAVPKATFAQSQKRLRQQLKGLKGLKTLLA